MTRRRCEATDQLWGGLALVIVDPSGSLSVEDGLVEQGRRQDRFYDIHRLVLPSARVLRLRQLPKRLRRAPARLRRLATRS
jgi:hypothetical protein